MPASPFGMDSVRVIEGIGIFNRENGCLMMASPFKTASTVEEAAPRSPHGNCINKSFVTTSKISIKLACFADKEECIPPLLPRLDPLSSVGSNGGDDDEPPINDLLGFQLPSSPELDLPRRLGDADEDELALAAECILLQAEPTYI